MKKLFYFLIFSTLFSLDAATQFGVLAFSPALHEAVKALSLESIEGEEMKTFYSLLEQTNDVNVRDSEGSTALHVLVNNKLQVIKDANRFEVLLHVAEHLIKKGIDVNAQDIWKRTSLHHAVLIGAYDVVQFLINAGADVIVKNIWGETPLHYTSVHGDCNIAQSLINAGADINAQTKNGRTPLHAAVALGQIEFAHFLRTRSGKE